MGRKNIIYVAFCVALVCGSAQARDRKSAGTQDREALSSVSSGREAHAVLARPLEATYSTRTNDATVQHDVRQSTAAPPTERKHITLFQFDSKIGHIAVEPVVGTVKGAQLSIGF